MKTLADLPVELLSLICEYVGGPDLRQGKGAAAKLHLFREWFAAAQPVFLDDLPGLRVYGHNVGRLLDGEWSESHGRPLMRKHARKLRVRLLGHWWDERHARAQAGLSLEELADNFYEVPTDSAEEGSPVEEAARPSSTAIAVWQSGTLKHALDSLFDDLGQFKALQSLVFEATSEGKAVEGGHGDYIREDTVCKLVRNLPLSYSLSRLTLDVNSTGLQSSRYSGRICHDIATMMPYVEYFRLRLPSICEDIFPASETLQAGRIKCKSLILKLHLPAFDLHDSSIPRPCTSDSETDNESDDGFDGEPSARQMFLHEYMARAAVRYIEALAVSSHRMELCRISHIRPETASVWAIDCLSMRERAELDFFYTEDQGDPCWNEHDDEELLDLGPYTFEHVDSDGRRV